jgi:L-asparaginase/Glu-tRNA(Gln) amidotransferase subunit D
MNFIDSVRVASSNLIKEVCICFHNDIIKGTRARKVTNEATKITNVKIGVYSSINLHLMGSINL